MIDPIYDTYCSKTSLSLTDFFVSPNISLTVNLVCVELSDVGVSLELLLGEREALRVVAVVGAGNVLRH